MHHARPFYRACWRFPLLLLLPGSFHAPQFCNLGGKNTHPWPPPRVPHTSSLLPPRPPFIRGRPLVFLDLPGDPAAVPPPLPGPSVLPAFSSCPLLLGFPVAFPAPLSPSPSPFFVPASPPLAPPPLPRPLPAVAAPTCHPSLLPPAAAFLSATPASPPPPCFSSAPFPPNVCSPPPPCCVPSVYFRRCIIS